MPGGILDDFIWVEPRDFFIESEEIDEELEKTCSRQSEPRRDEDWS